MINSYFEAFQEIFGYVSQILSSEETKPLFLSSVAKQGSERANYGTELNKIQECCGTSACASNKGVKQIRPAAKSQSWNESVL